MKKLLIIILMLLIAFPSYAGVLSAAAKTKLIPHKDDLLAAIPNTETHCDPTWVDPLDGTECPEVAKYNDAQWIDEWVKRQLKRFIRHGEKLQNERNYVESDIDLE